MPVPADDIGIETQRSLGRILTLRFRIIVVHAEMLVARLMMSTARAAGMLNGDVSNRVALCARAMREGVFLDAASKV